MNKTHSKVGNQGAQLVGAGSSINEDFELGQYIHAFTISSNRVRYVIIAVVVATLFIFMEFWNSRPKSWVNMRINAVRDALEEVLEARQLGRWPSLPEAARLRNLESEETIKLHLEQLEAAYVSRVLEPQVPALGISFDLNDLGIFGGITLLLLLVMLTYSLDRQYENLFLSLWKVEMLHRADGKEDRESKANLLYHALAMAQVFTQPPTLSRWRPSLTTKHLAKLLFFLPPVVHVLVMWQNYVTIRYATTLKPKYPSVGMNIQLILLFLLLFFAIICCVYSRAGDERWRRIFFRINPSCLENRPPSWLDRMMLPALRIGPWRWLEAGHRADYRRASIITNDRELTNMLDRIAIFQRQVSALRAWETNPANYHAAVSSLLAEVDRMQLEVREYLCLHPAELAS